MNTEKFNMVQKYVSPEYLSELRDLMLLQYYVLAKDRILNSDGIVHPFRDTVGIFFPRKSVRDQLMGQGLLDENHLWAYLENLLDHAIRED